ncbi:LysR family transcriptional regulator [Paraburkholderia sp. 22B1P]|uniref:LysR family transcriptional regulator n=1 Tax=Paraburkholderia sp. 22B1P TaxID=3080498 RepID=UPI00308B1F07|nr:LysR family transcriptional regulator [Paraburkholderia sp. 22B1P]
MDLNLLGVFVEIVRANSLSAAARRLGVTRSRVSQQLQQLEREIDAQLIFRTARTLELSDAGRTLYDCAERIAEDIAVTCASIDSIGKTLVGRMRVSVPTGFRKTLIEAVLLDFTALHPGIQLTVKFDNHPQDLVDAGIDVALRITSSPPLDYVARQVCSITWGLYASRDYMADHSAIRVPGDLQKHAVVAAADGLRSIPIIMTSKDRGEEEQCLHLEPVLQSSDYPFLIQAVSKGMGIGLFPAYIGSLPGADSLEHLLPAYEVKGQPDALYIVSRPNRYASSPITRLIEYLRDEISGRLAGLPY